MNDISRKNSLMSFPSVPQGVNQILITLCLVIVYIMYESYDSRVNERNSLQKQTIEKLEEALDLKYKNAEEQIQLYQDSLSLTFDISQIDRKKSTLMTYLQSLKKNKIKLNENTIDSFHEASYELADSGILKNMQLNKITLKLAQRRDEKVAQIKEINFMLKKTKENISLFPYFIVIFLCFILFVSAIADLLRNEYFSKEIAKTEFYKNKLYKRCQSCAKIFSPKLLHGTEKDGSVNKGFCIECYQDGQFTNPELTSDEVITALKSYNPEEKKVEKIVKEMVRWNQNPYK